MATLVRWPGWAAGESSRRCLPTVPSAPRLSIATVGIAPLTRDVAGEGRVVATQSPTLYAQGAGTVALGVQAGDSVKLGQAVVHVD